MSKSSKVRDAVAFKHHISAKRKKIVMNDAWWERQRQAFYKKDSVKSNTMGFDKTDDEIEADWQEYKKVLIEENTTYIDIYDIGKDHLERLFHKRVESLTSAQKLTKNVKDIVELINTGIDSSKKLKDHKNALRDLMLEYEFEGLENEIVDNLYVSSLTGWEIDAHIAAEDFELIK